MIPYTLGYNFNIIAVDCMCPNIKYHPNNDTIEHNMAVVVSVFMIDWIPCKLIMFCNVYAFLYSWGIYPEITVPDTFCKFCTISTLLDKFCEFCKTFMAVLYDW